MSPDSTLRQALEKMEYHRYSAVPLVDEHGRYAGTITEGDLLWKLKNTPDLTFANAHQYTLRDVPQRMNNKTAQVDAEIEDLIGLAKVQNFVPVNDDKGVFIGIIKRSDIIDYCHKQLFR